MATNYPAALDTTTQLPNTWTDATTSATVHAQVHNNISDAIRAMQAEEGINPSGSFTDVASRLNARLTCRKTADQTISSTVALTNVTDMALPVGTTAIDYYFKFVLIATSSAGGTNGIRVGVTTPTIAGHLTAQVTIPRTIDPNPAAGTAQATPTVTTMPYVGTITSSGDSVVSDIVPVGINFVVVVEGILSNPSATGNIQLQAANEVSTASGNILRRGAWGEVYIA